MVKRPPPNIGTLATTPSAGTPGLPRGRGSLREASVAREHRGRLLRAIIAAVAELGYHEVSIAEIVRRARVSRQVFYAHYDSKEDCFNAAAARGIKLLMERMAVAVGSGHAGMGFIDLQRASIRAYLQTAQAEPEFTRCLVLETLAAGPKVYRIRNSVMLKFAQLIALSHRAARAQHPRWPALSDTAYLGLAGAIQELMYQALAADKPRLVGELEEPIMELLAAALTR